MTRKEQIRDETPQSPGGRMTRYHYGHYIKKITRGIYEFKGYRIQRYEDGDLKGWWDVLSDKWETRVVINSHPYPRLRDALNFVEKV